MTKIEEKAKQNAFVDMAQEELNVIYEQIEVLRKKASPLLKVKEDALKKLRQLAADEGDIETLFNDPESWGEMGEFLRNKTSKYECSIGVSGYNGNTNQQNISLILDNDTELNEIADVIESLKKYFKYSDIGRNYSDTPLEKIHSISVSTSESRLCYILTDGKDWYTATFSYGSFKTIKKVETLVDALQWGVVVTLVDNGEI